MKAAALAGVLVAMIPILPAAAIDQVQREAEIGDLRLGQRMLVDDGTCPAGQIKEVVGAKMTNNGVQRSQRCIPRVGRR